MSLERYRNDNPRTAEELRSLYQTYMEAQAPEAGLGFGTANRAHVTALTATLAENQEQALSTLYDAGYIHDATDEELTKNAREVGISRKPPVAATGVVRFQRDSAATQDYVIQEGTSVSTGGLEPTTFVTTETVTLPSGDTSVKADIVASNAGEQGNVAADAIDTTVSNVEGVDSATNPNPVGDTDFTDTEGNTLRVGRNRESDEELRARALEATSVGGASTAEAVETALQNLDDVITASFRPNPTGSSVDGLDPYHGEAIVYGDSADEIAETLKSSLSITNLLRLQGGVHGTKETATVRVDLIDQIVTVPITRPPRIDLSITVDLVHGAAYEGQNAVKDAIVDYIGGTSVDGSNVVGLGQAEDVVVDQLDSRITSLNGIVATTSLVIDSTGDGSDDTTTDDDGVLVFDVSGSEVPRVAATDISVNETEQS